MNLNFQVSMTRLLILLSLLASGIGWGCAADLAATATPPTRSVKVELQFSPDPAERITRTADEEAIRDINLYLFGRSNGQSLHFYSRSALVRFECLPGEYDLYVAANLGADLGERSAQQLLDCTIGRQEEYATLPMSAVMTVAIAPDKENNTVTLPTLSVRRTVAKIAYNIRVADKVPDLELRSVRLCSVPGHTTLFTPASTPSTSEKDFTDAPLVELPDAARRSCSGVQYLFENPQGTVPSITDQRDKNADNAPACASYLMIRATRGSRILDYRIYLGENNTTDFNVGRNTAHTLDITISGDNEVDTRVHGYTLSVTDDFESNRIGDYCVLPFNASLYVNIERAESEPTLTGELELLTPTDGTFLVDYDECDPRYDLSLYYQQGSNYYELVYYPKVITEARARLAYEVRVRDSYGYESRSRFEHCFANALYVVPSGGGTVSAAGALHAETANGGMLRAACYERGCTLTAKADAGYRFAGWYADEGHSELLCESETYSYVPKTYATSLYPLFVTEKVHILTDIYTVHFECDAPVEVDQDEESFIVPAGSRCTIRAMEPALLTGWYDAFDKSRRQLITADKTYSFVATEKRIIAPDYAEGTDLSAAGTANSYIAPRMQEIYLFDATVQGNGRATTGITPQKLKGTSARLIWQTGTAERAVVCDVGYNGSRISFRTGTAIGGNALIGLFDAAGRCIWSWHIWATNGALTTHVYPSGYVFMDRNLGAENLDPGDPASRGLYYQWGRKDPFPYDLAAFDYGEGFAFGTYYGEDSSTATVTWAAAHPATLLGRAADPSDPAQRLSSWLGQPSPNLWGNASTGGRPTTAGAKSIYDPCPPGWRVPPPEAWTLEQTTVSSTIEGGCYLYTGSVWPYYPYAGLLHVMPTGKEMYVGVGIRTQLWTNAPGSPASDPSRVDATTAVSFGVLPPEVLQLYRQNHQAAAYPVRCVKE
jgi:hypothetical protein